jgi:hypothetical protein
MSRINRWMRWAVVASVLMLAHGAWAVDRTRNPRTPASKAKSQQPIAEAELTLPQESVLGEDHQKNIEALQREKIEALRNRVDMLTRGASLGRVTPNQLDHATLDQLQAELEVQDRPHLRIQTLKKIIELRQKIEEEAKQGASTPRGKPGDVGPWLAAHGRYTSAKLARINAQLALEREQIAPPDEKGKPDAPGAKTDKSPTPGEKPK